MKFGIIFSVDVPKGVDIETYIPDVRDELEKDEGDEQYKYDYLGGRWSEGHHIQLAGVLNQDQFEDLLWDTGLRAMDARTMGSIGAPTPDGTNRGRSPAIAFTSGPPDAIIDAYVTPYPETRKEPPFNERDWERVRSAVIRKYS